MSNKIVFQVTDEYARNFNDVYGVDIMQEFKDYILAWDPEFKPFASNGVSGILATAILDEIGINSDGSIYMNFGRHLTDKDTGEDVQFNSSIPSDINLIV